MKLLTILIVLLIPFSGLSFTFTDLFQHETMKYAIGGYYLFLGYQIITDKPIVFEVDLSGQKIGGFNIGGVIVIDKNVSDTLKNSILAHEREHMYQNALGSIILYNIFYGSECLRSYIIDQNYYSHNLLEQLAFEAQFKYANNNFIPYFSITFPF